MSDNPYEGVIGHADFCNKAHEPGDGPCARIAGHPPRTGSYDEMLISQAGGDGEHVNVRLIIRDESLNIIPVEYTNVPMHRVKLAMEILNADEVASPRVKLILNSLYGKHATPPSPAPRREDFQLTELFGWYDGVSGQNYQLPRVWRRRVIRVRNVGKAPHVA